MSDASKRKEKQKWAIEKPKLDNARKLRGIYFIEPDDEEFNDVMKNTRRKLEIPMPMPCNIQREKYKETCRTVEEHKRKYACIVEADESMRKRMEGSPRKIMKIILQEKGCIHRVATIWCTNLFLCLTQAMKIPDAKAAVEKHWKTRENTGMAANESQKQK